MSVQVTLGGWTHHRDLTALDREESRSNLEKKLYVIPEKGSRLSWAFCFSWLTVYTLVMESTADGNSNTFNTALRPEACRCAMTLTSFIFERLILVQDSRLRYLFGVAEQKPSLSGVWSDKCKLTPQQEDVYFVKQSLLSRLPEFTHHQSHHGRENYSAHILLCGCDISPGLTVIMVLELTVAAMQFRKLSKVTFASDMKSTLEKK